MSAVITTTATRIRGHHGVQLVDDVGVWGGMDLVVIEEVAAIVGRYDAVVDMRIPEKAVVETLWCFS